MYTMDSLGGTSNSIYTYLSVYHWDFRFGSLPTKTVPLICIEFDNAFV